MLVVPGPDKTVHCYLKGQSHEKKVWEIIPLTDRLGINLSF
jgi:hypothetical protein